METKNIEQELRDDLFSAKKTIRTLKDYLITFKTYIDLKEKYESESQEFFGACCSGCEGCDPDENWIKVVNGKIVNMTEYERKEKEIDLDLQLQNVIYLENRIKNIMEFLTQPIKRKGNK